MLYRGFLCVEKGPYRHLYFDSNSTPRYPRYQGIIITRGLSNHQSIKIACNQLSSEPLLFVEQALVSTLLT